MELSLKSYQSSWRGDVRPLSSLTASPQKKLLWLWLSETRSKKKTKKNDNRCFVPRAYIEKPDPVYDFFNKVVGSLPIVGLVSRILSDDGGVGSDRIQFKEFCGRVYRNFSPEVPEAFFEFEKRNGSAARPQYILLWCWAAALGAGLLRTEDMMLGATRLRVSYDVQYEEENLNILMDQAAKKRKKAKSTVPFVPYEVRAIKALDAICRCCVGAEEIEEEDARLLTVILQGVFPAADKEAIEAAVREKIISAENRKNKDKARKSKKSRNREKAVRLMSDMSVDNGVSQQQSDVVEASKLGNK